MQKGSDKPKMFLVIEGWKKSGQSQQAYCKEQGIRYQVFHHWYKVYRDKQAIEVYQPLKSWTNFSKRFDAFTAIKNKHLV